MENIRISAVAAVGKDRELGRENKLIWKLEADFERMKKLIKGHPLIMGRTTYESIGRELPGSTSIVITRDKDYQSPYRERHNTRIVHSLEEAFAEARKIEEHNNTAEKEIFIFGGAKVYTEALKETQRLYITEIEASDSKADAFFPEYSDFSTVLEESEHFENGIQYRLLTLER